MALNDLGFLTSETIYRPDGLNALIKLMGEACGYGAGTKNREGRLEETTRRKLSLGSPLIRGTYTCLVAAKVLYFGVGGGVSQFVRAVEEGTHTQEKSLGKVEVVWVRKGGVTAGGL